MAPPLVWPCHRVSRQLTRDRGRAVRRRRRRHLGQLEAAFTLCHCTAGASKSWRASQGQTSSTSVTLAVSSAGNVNGTLPKGKRNQFSFSQIEPFRSVQRQRGGGVGVRQQGRVGVRPRRKEGERRPDAPAGQHHPWSPGATWYRSSYYFRNIGIVLFSPSTSAPSASSISIKSPSIHSRHSFQVVLSYFLISNLQDAKNPAASTLSPLPPCHLGCSTWSRSSRRSLSTFTSLCPPLEKSPRPGSQ